MLLIAFYNLVLKNNLDMMEANQKFKFAAKKDAAILKSDRKNETQQ